MIRNIIGLMANTTAGGGAPPEYPAGITHRWNTQGMSLSNGDPVTTFPAVVGGVNFSQASGSLKPIYRTNELNGYAAIDFDGTDDLMQLASSLSAYGDGSILIVMKSDASGSGFILDMDNDTDRALIQGFVSGKVEYYRLPARVEIGNVSTTNYQVFAHNNIETQNCAWVLGAATSGGLAPASVRVVDIIFWGGTLLTSGELADAIAAAEYEYNL
jgi:hypothetical protein